MTTDDQYIFAWVNGGRRHAWIAKKLAMKEEDVQERYDQIAARLKSQEADGVNMEGQLTDFNNLCLQYQTMGETLKIVANGMSNVAQYDEVLALVVQERKNGANDEDITLELMNRFIIMRAWPIAAVPVLEPGKPS